MTESVTTSAPGGENLVLAGDFDSPSMAEWQDAVAKVLNRGRPEDKQLSGEQAVARLRTTTVDGLTIDPIYTKDDAVADRGYPGAAPFTRGTFVRDGDMDAWDIRALYEDGDAERTRQQIDDDLRRGVTSLWLRVDPDALAPADLEAALKNVFLNLAKVDVFSRTDQEAAAEALLALCEKSELSLSDLRVGLGLDPIGLAALQGTTPTLDTLPEWVRRIESYKQTRAITVDGTIWHNAGAGDVHEIAWALATGVEYARHLIEQGISADEAFDAMTFRLTATTDQFSTIAKMRAIRTCWNRIGEVLGAAADRRGARIHAVTSWREITRDDPYVNMLRGTICCFGAAVGDAEAVTVLPFDTAWGLPTAFSRRIARNTQLLLAEESNIGRVNDPAGGSWYVEKLTDMLTERAWAELQRVEAQGGMAKLVADKAYQATLDELNTERGKRLATRKQPITGVSEFPKIDEVAPQGTLPRPTAPNRNGVAWHRDSEVFEGMRDRANAMREAGSKPSVFLACLGTRRDYGPREGFASNLFHVAGLETPESDGGSPEEIVAQWSATGSPVACLCSSAKVYAEQGLTVAKALKDAGAKTVLLAGNLKELGDAETDGVIDGTIAMGMDVVASLSTILNTLGEPK